MAKNLNFDKISVHEGPKQSPGFLLWQISTSWRSALEKTLKTLDLTHPQFVMLACASWLTRKGDLITQAAIGKMAGLDPNTNSQIIKGLEKKKLVRRVPSTDGRAKNVSLTPAGSHLLKQALPVVEKADENFFNPLSTQELDLLMKMFQKLIS
jgi:MarR family transcriptional regulator, organic hydroperoxide resistance regulator